MLKLLKSGLYFLIFGGNIIISSQIKAAPTEIVVNNVNSIITINNSLLDTLPKDSIDSLLIEKVKFKRGKAIIFTILTGLLGGHRIYLGTHQRVPIIYSVTLGGFGILPLVDLLNIIFTKDLSKFENNPKVIMWGK